MSKPLVGPCSHGMFIIIGIEFSQFQSIGSIVSIFFKNIYGNVCWFLIKTISWTQLMYRFNRWIDQSLEHTIVPGGEELTLSCETFPSMWALGEDRPVIPKVTFIYWMTTFQLGTVRSLRRVFVPAQWVGPVVKLSSTFSLKGNGHTSNRCHIIRRHKSRALIRVKNLI